MKLIKLRLYIISFVSFLTVTMVSAQQDAKWRLSLGVNAVDIRTPDDFTGFFKDYFNGSIEDVNLYGQPFRLAVTRKLTDNWSTQVS